MAYKRRFLHALLSLLLLTLPTLALSLSTLSTRPDVTSLINQWSSHYSLAPNYIRQAIDSLEYKPSIIQKMGTPGERKPWPVYRNTMVNADRIQLGLAFWKANERTLQRTWKIYGVSPEIIVAILGIESRYGTIQGRYRVLDALGTLAFYYPKRAAFFQKEFLHFLLLCQELGLDPKTVQGSYAGAMGQAQFMPSSYRRYAIDFSGKGKRDLHHNTEDVIGSVAYFLKQHGWQPGQTVAVPAQIINPSALSLLKTSYRTPNITAKELSRYGLKPLLPLVPTTPLGVFRLEGSKGTEFWLGLPNFYVIKRYNVSVPYVIAVRELASLIQQKHVRETL